MRIHTMFSLDSDVVAQMKSTAADVGVSSSALAELAIKLLLTHPRERLEAWAEKHRALKPARKAGPQMTPSVQQVLTVLDDRPQTRSEIQALTGQSAGIVWRSLRALEAQGLAKPDRFVPQQIFKPLLGVWTKVTWTRVGQAGAAAQGA